MYTIVTCAPFSIQELCGDNVTLGTEEGTSKAQEERRIIVKYTDLKGTLRDFQIRTWPVSGLGVLVMSVIVWLTFSQGTP